MKVSLGIHKILIGITTRYVAMSLPICEVFISHSSSMLIQRAFLFRTGLLDFRMGLLWLLKLFYLYRHTSPIPIMIHV